MVTGNNNMNKKAEIPIIKKRETPAPRNMYDLNEHLINNMKHPVSGRADSGSSEAI